MKVSKKFLLFCIFGLIATAIDLLAFNIYFYFSINFVISRIGGILTSFLFTFSVNRNITFKSQSKRIKTQFSKFITLYAFSMALNTLVGLAIISIFQSESLLIANIAAIVGILVSMTLNYLGSKHWVFHY
jgi:putative flippase GtrA